MSKQKNALIVGGSGFIGSHVADYLSQKGFKVHILDKVDSKWFNEDQDITVGDLLDQDLIDSLVNKSDIVYHFASIADIAEANLDPVEAVKQNILGTTYLLDSCSKAKVERFIFASSLYVYSNYGGFYRSTKQASEFLIEDYQRLKDLDYTILRFGSLYGPRANKFNWVHNAIWQALTSGKIERDGNGEEVRDYIHVLDAARASVEILDNNLIKVKMVNSNVVYKGVKVKMERVYSIKEDSYLEERQTWLDDLNYIDDFFKNNVELQKEYENISKKNKEKKDSVIHHFTEILKKDSLAVGNGGGYMSFRDDNNDYYGEIISITDDEAIIRVNKFEYPFGKIKLGDEVRLDGVYQDK